MLALARTPTAREQAHQLWTEMPIASNLSLYMFESDFLVTDLSALGRRKTLVLSLSHCGGWMRPAI